MKRLIWFAFVLPLTVYAQDPITTARNFILQNKGNALLNGVQNLELSVSASYQPQKSGNNYVYFNQEVDGIPVYNAIYNVVVGSKDKILHSVHSFENNTNQKEKIDYTKVISPPDAYTLVAKSLGISGNATVVQKNTNLQNYITRVKMVNSQSDTVTAQLEWLPRKDFGKEPKENVSLALCWRINIDSPKENAHFLVHIQASSGLILKSQDLVTRCNFGPTPHMCKETHEHTANNNSTFAPNSYNVFDIPTESPLHGPRTIVTNPYSRFLPAGMGPGTTNGWHSDGYTDYTITRGNNVWAQEDINDDDLVGDSPSSATLVFNFPYTHGLSTAVDNRNAAITNLFYWSNLLHNVLYRYGFDEPSGNFQNHNMGKGGLGNDYVIAEAQDGGDINNASFYTPPDGQTPRMEMHLFSNAGGYQPDSDFDNGIISHEYGHGWSTRLTGGPATNTCLQNSEQAGEGWSDYLSLMVTTDWRSLSPTLASANIPRGMGTYVKGQPISGSGIRPYQYSYDMENVNPLVTYGKVADTENFSIPHGIGSIWATMLWDMTWEIILQDGVIVKDIWKTDSLLGNVAALKLVHEGLRLQPCSPSFVDARNAILLADIMFFDGRYRCSIDRAFARRGLGGNATTGKSSNDREVFEDFSPITGPKLTSPTLLTTCSGQAFNYTATSSTSGVSFTWSRASVAGISNTAATGSGNSINETLTNTSASTITVKYIIKLSPPVCGGEPFGYTVQVRVLPAPSLTVSEYHVCQGGEIPEGAGLKTEHETEGEPLNANLNITTSSPIFTRYLAGGINYYYHLQTYTAGVTGEYTIDLSSTAFDPYLYVYSSFNPANPSAGLLGYNDDQGLSPNSRVTLTLAKDQTIYIVSTSYYTSTIGAFNLQVNSSSIVFTYDYWFKDPLSSTPLASGAVFNPLNVSGSGITDTSTPGTYVFYYSGDTERLCRTPVYFVVDAFNKNLNLSTNITSGITQEQASQTIVATNLVVPPANVTYKAGKSIELLPGFEAKNGAVFKAFIGGCE